MGPGQIAQRERNAQIIAAVKRKIKRGDIARKYGITVERIRQIAVGEGGIPVRRREDPQKLRKRRAHILRDFHRGWTVKDICNKYKIYSQWVGKIIRKETGKGLWEHKRERHQALVEDYRKGKSVDALITKYKLHPITVRIILRQKGNAVIIKKKQQTRLRYEQILAQFKQGMRVAQLAEQYGITRGTIRQILWWNGVKLNEISLQRRQELYRQVEKEFLHNHNRAEIARKLGVSISTVRQILCRNILSKYTKITQILEKR